MAYNSGITADIRMLGKAWQRFVLCECFLV